MSTSLSRALLPSLLAFSAGALTHLQAAATALTEPVSPASYADTALTGTTFAARPELGGLIIEDVISDFSFAGVTGTVQNRVVREFGTGTLDFYWRINVTGSDTGAGVSAFRLDDFGYDFLTDADWRSDGLGTTAPDIARLFLATNHPEGALNFLFDSGIAPGTDSMFFFLHTDAVAYTKTATFDLLTTGAQALSPVYATFAPSAVPEPETCALAAVGLAVAAWGARRRRSA